MLKCSTCKVKKEISEFTTKTEKITKQCEHCRYLRVKNKMCECGIYRYKCQHHRRPNDTVRKEFLNEIIEERLTDKDVFEEHIKQLIMEQIKELNEEQIKEIKEEPKPKIRFSLISSDSLFNDTFRHY